MAAKLVNIMTGAEVKPGDQVNTVRGEKAILRAFVSNATLRVQIAGREEAECYPSAIGARFMEV